MHIFDTHAHLVSDDPGRYPPSLLRGRTAFVPAHDTVSTTVDWLLARMDEEGVSQACLVQRAHIYGYDNSYILDSAAGHADRLLPVAVLDAEEPATPDIMRELAEKRGLRGVRFAATDVDRYDTGWLNSPAALACWQAAAALNLPVAVIFYRRHISYGVPALAMIAGMYPELPIIVDHVGTAHTASNNEVAWYAEQRLPLELPAAPDFGLAALDGLMAHGNVRLKLTSIVFDRLADSGVDNSLFVRSLADRFGAERLMWGSDVGQSPGSFAEKVAAARHAASRLDEAEQAWLLNRTATETYRR